MSDPHGSELRNEIISGLRVLASSSVQDARESATQPDLVVNTLELLYDDLCLPDGIDREPLSSLLYSREVELLRKLMQQLNETREVRFKSESAVVLGLPSWLCVREGAQRLLSEMLANNVS